MICSTFVAPAIQAMTAEYGDRLQKLAATERRLVKLILLDFLEAPQPADPADRDIYESIDRVDPDAILGEQLAWFHIAGISFEPTKAVREFVGAIAAE